MPHLAPLPSAEWPHAEVTFYNPTGARITTAIVARNSRELDRKIIEKLEALREIGNRIIKTRLVIGHDEYTYEYDKHGRIEHVFRNGEITP